ncbi:MAG: GH39 family glycosyl hydrolase [Thermoleophilaceae bacterium]
MCGRGIALLVTAAALALSGTATAAVPDDFYGVNADRMLNDQRPSAWDDQLQAIAATGIRVVRSDAFWADAEPGPPLLGIVHQWNWTGLDQRAAALSRAGLRWLPVLDYGTPWAESHPTPDDHSPPSHAADFGAYAQAFAKRYGPGGDFWSSHPELTPLPVTTYEIWNEPNRSDFWAPRPDPGGYADLYSAARAAIRQVEPGAQVIVGGLANSDPVGFIRGLYSAGIGDVDGVGLHPYARDVPGVLATLALVRAALAPGTPIYVTETGWPTRGMAEGAGGLPDATRGGDLALLADALARSDCGVRDMVVYSWVTAQSDPNDAGDWFGIAGKDGSATASSRAYAAAIRRNSSGASGAPLQICSGAPIRGAAPLDFGAAAQVVKSGLTLGLSVKRVPGHGACFRARVTYEGLPVNRAAVRFAGLRPLSRRNRRPKVGRTAADGTSTECGRRPRRSIRAVASLAGIAASAPAAAP